MGVAPPPQANAAAVQRDVDLRAGDHLFPPPDQIPDLTGGFGTQVYNWTQDIGAQLSTAFVDNFNLVALLQAAGLDPATVIRNAINDALGDVIGGSGVEDLSVDLGPILAQTPLGPVVALLEANPLIDFSTQLPVGKLLDALGVDLSDPLSALDNLGINIITAGGPFTLLRLLGVDLGWTPSFPNSVADEINNTEYLSVSLDTVFEALGLPTDGRGLEAIKLVLDGLGIHLPALSTDVIDLRVPIVAGWGLGAFAAGAAYQQVVDDLPNQPGGSAYTGTSNPLLGSFTVLPMLLLDNPGRANGGILARAYPFFRLLGIDTVTPDTQVQSDGDSILGGLPLLGDIPLLGLTPGGANLIPIKIDATAEYLPMSDFAAWPNPFTMANNVAAGMFPTYILRNQSLDTLGTVLIDQVLGDLGTSVTDYLANPGTDPQLGPKLNVYITIPANSLPLLEPTYLAVDVINLFTGANLNNPIGTALSPVLTSLVNLGYTDVEYNPATGIYERTLDEADIPTAFGTLPADVDWAQVPGHLVNNLATGIQKAIRNGLVNQNPVSNPIKTLLGLLGLGDAIPSGGSGLDLSALTDAVENLAPNPLADARTQSVVKTNFAPQAITETDIGGTENKTLTLNAEADAGKDIQPEAKSITATADDARRQVDKSLNDAGDRAKASAEKARERTATAVKEAQKRVNAVAENGRKQIQAAAEGVVKGAEKAVNGLKGEDKDKATNADDAKAAKKPAKKDTKKDTKKVTKKETKKDAA
ncbi:AAA family ATPase [Mycobacterium sp. GA-1841]|uniref:AAA family ATPase n=1 Tax=Mycobacterium sp. GA-1841 TaxID=1834154 RepID=UPI00097AC72D|nr:AAA family ATPase [Mycobacterium sp. GA-1841]OMC33990.1 AAA family ATPase [Mycobacterium sp. GA-1841]